MAAHYKEINLFDEIYRVALDVVVCQDTDRWSGYLEAAGYREEPIHSGMNDGCFYRLNKNNSDVNRNVIFLRKKSMGTLIHELSHLIFFTYTERNVPLTLDNDEAFAYYLEFWFNKVREKWGSQ